MANMHSWYRALPVCVYALFVTMTDVALAQQAQQVAPIWLPTVVVTAQKDPADSQELPVSVTVVQADTIENAGISNVSEAAIYVPNAYFVEFTARKLSNAFFRGVGSSPANPGVTTFFDGVPQLNANSSSIELTDLDRIEFVRGPQSALFGRNTLGGLVNVVSARPSLSAWTASANVPFGSDDAVNVRASASGPLIENRLGVSLSFGHGRRAGFTRNEITGNDLDSRSASFGKVQVLWTPAAEWEARLIVTAERARDGDYALQDLESLRRTPFRAARDFEGYTHRDVAATTVLTRREGQRVSFASTTGFVRWTTHDETDLDYTPLPLATRDNEERDFQFTQEVRFASAPQADIRLSDGAGLRWQSGLFFFTQGYEQDAVNTFAPFLLSPFLGFPVTQSSPQSELDDFGVGFYGQATAVLGDRLDLSVGARVDYERKEGTLRTAFTPAIAPERLVVAEESFSNVSPQASATFRLRPNQTVYATVASGFKAGGFNPASPPGSEAYGEERTWHAEGGVKTLWADGRVSTNAAVFFIDWQDLQLNLPDPSVPGQFYIANVGGATSRGVEVEVNARVHPNVDLFGSLGYTNATFSEGSVSRGRNVQGNELPNTPDYTATIGTQLSRMLSGSTTLYGRAEAVFLGAFQYDDANTAGQSAYSLANVRAGVRGAALFAEVWVKNAFDTRYIPLAFAYEAFAPSGFVGESGRPRTFGVTLGATF